MLRRTEARKGQTIGVDFALSITVFTIAIAIGIYYANLIALPNSPFSSQIQSSAVRATENFDNQVTWEFQQAGIAFSSSAATQYYPVEQEYFYMNGTDFDTVTGMQDGEHIPAQHDRSQNETTLLANLSSGYSRPHIVFSVENDLLPVTNLTGLNTSETSNTFTVENQDMESVFDSEGLASVTLDGQDLVIDADMEGSDSNIQNISGPVRSKFVYDDAEQKTFRAFARSNRIRFHHNNTGSAVYTFNLSTDFTDVTVSNHSGGQTSETLDAGTAYNGEADALVFETGDEDLFIALEDMDVFVYRENAGGYVEVNMTVDGVQDMVVLPQQSIDRSTQEELFFAMEQTLLPTREVEGYGSPLLQDFVALSPQQQRARLEVRNLVFNVTVGGELSIGDRLSSAQEAFVVEYPAPLLDRFGNVSRREVYVGVWR